MGLVQEDFPHLFGEGKWLKLFSDRAVNNSCSDGSVENFRNQSRVDSVYYVEAELLV